ncbi:MAG: threonine--tRNA ligase [Flavobacteriales bacterium]|jgi:threonyl-tRNA synthetase|nr:MAG: threonine--tRNA ligase [Flavobacteriales bacterium]|tara:strand:- start:1994 stop:3919 length:1926 start_codon:yes stop_codon:yes gene_type:complete
MINITLKDGSVKQYSEETSVISIAKDISEGLARNVISANFNDKVVEVNSMINEDGKLEFYTWDNDEGKSAFWHSSSHVMAQSIQELFPGVKLTIGPAINSGFYYDVDLGSHKISESDFDKIESRMLEICREKHDFNLRSVSKKEAIKFYKEEDNDYKLELINDLKDGEITFCDHSNFTDLCKGGHIPNTSIIKAVKILNISGAFWRADQNNKQLTRIYGISFPKQKLLKEYLNNIEQAKLRDHRKIGKNLKLFSFSSKVGLGLPLWLPKGVELRDRLEGFLKKAQKKAGYQMVITPHIGNKELYVTSGHYEKYGDDSFQPIKTPKENEEFYLKPMNCPHHCEIYNSNKFSYKDLPVRYAEFGTVYRYEQSGELHGLTRVRGFTQDDAHIFCTEDQLDSEFKNVIDLTLYVFKSLGLDDYSAQISIRDPKNMDKYIGDIKAWEKSEKAIIKAVKDKGLKYKIEEGEAAFYGPKLDFMVKDALGREWQLGTIQVDYNLPDRFNLTYIDKNNDSKRPVMIHRAPFGSLERFIAILLENTAGNLPLWLTPNQFIILPISEKHEKYCENVLNLLENNEIRGLIDNRSETIGRKIRDAELEKIPFMLIIGEQESNQNLISLRSHGGEDYGKMKVEDFVKIIKEKTKI